MSERHDAQSGGGDAHAGPPASTQDVFGLGDSRAMHVLRCGVVGAIAGLIAVAFRWAIHASEQGRLSLLSRVRELPHSELWGWCVLPLMGLVLGSLIGLAVVRFSPESAGSGIPHIKGVLLHVRTLRWWRLLPVKFIGGALGIGLGLSLGREGPTVQLGAGVGKAVADVLRVPSRSMPLLVSAGAGAGVAAAFNAPLAGFLFVIEELHRELSARTFAGALVAALAADIVARALAGGAPAFAIQGYPALPLSALPVVVCVGVAGGLGGVVFNRVLLASGRVARERVAMPRWLLVGVACAMCGLVAWWLPMAVGSGHATAERVLSLRLGAGSGWGIGLVALLLAAKFVLTVVSYASGAPGGVFAPMLLMGALLGSLIAAIAGGVWPSLLPHATALAIIGMAAWFTGSVRAPLTGIVLIVEMTGNYQQLLALGVACLFADLTAASIRGRPLYESLLEADLRASGPERGGGAKVRAPKTMYVGVQRGSLLEGREIRVSGLPAGCLIVAIERQGEEVYPSSDVVLLSGDHITIVVPEDAPERGLEVVRLATGME